MKISLNDAFLSLQFSITQYITVDISGQENSSALTTGFGFDNESLCFSGLPMVMVIFEFLKL